MNAQQHHFIQQTKMGAYKTNCSRPTTYISCYLGIIIKISCADLKRIAVINEGWPIYVIIFCSLKQKINLSPKAM